MKCRIDNMCHNLGEAWQSPFDGFGFERYQPHHFKCMLMTLGWPKYVNCGIGGEELSSTSFLWILLWLLCVVSCCMDVLFGFFIRIESTLCCVYCCVVVKSGFLLRFESRPSVASLEVLFSHFLVLNYVKGWSLLSLHRS